MILKGSQRGHGSDLATHLCNEFDNERIELAEVRGTVAADLHGFAAEIEAVAAGTKATQPFFSVSINPHEKLTRDQYAAAVQQIEDRLGLSGQPRAIIFHEKLGFDGITREHAHVVWSRIDGQKMRAIPMSHFKVQLCDIACDLAHEYGHELPEGLKAWAEKRERQKRKQDSSLAENSAKEKTGLTPDERRAQVTALWQSADSGAAFRNAVEQQGYVLARGDRRGFVLIDEALQVHSLSRQIEGASAKQIAKRMDPLTPADLPSVDDAKQEMQARLQARTERLKEDARDQAAGIERDLRQYEQGLRAKLRRIHERRRETLAAKKRALKSRQDHERTMLTVAQAAAQIQIGFRVRNAVVELIARTPGFRSVLGPLQKLGLDPKLKQEKERKALAERHDRERREIARKDRALQKIEAREVQSLERKLLRKRRLAEAEGLAGLKTKQADEQQQNQTVRHTETALLQPDELARRFRSAAQDANQNVSEDGDGDDDGYSWKSRAASYDRKHGKGRGLNRRDDDGDDHHDGGDDGDIGGPDHDPFGSR